MLAVRLPTDIEQRLDALAKATGRTKSYYVREAIIEHLEDMEDIYQADLAFEKRRLKKEPTFSLTEVEQDLDLKD